VESEEGELEAEEEEEEEEKVEEEEGEAEEQPADEELEDEPSTTPTIKREPASTQFPPSQMPLSQRKLRIEILDSDADSDGDGEEDDVKSENTEIWKEEESDEELQHETYYGDIGLETQMAAERLLSSQGSSEYRQESQVLGEGGATVSQFESQRISAQHADAMAPRTHDSDVFISLHPPHVRNIRNRTKDHEFRTWALPPSVMRIWIYETAPASKIQYMATIGPAKYPGDILDERGVGNAEFNAKAAGSSEYAYEILDLYELANPQTLADLKKKEWLKGPPQKMAWVRPAVLDDLMGNLKPPIFTRHPVRDITPPSSSTDTQEVEGQLLSTIRQFTQPPSAGQALSTPFLKEEAQLPEPVSSHHTGSTPVLRYETSSLEEYSQSVEPESPHRIPPSQAETVDLTQSETPKRHNLPEVIWESPTRPVPSSTPHLPTPFTRASTRSESIVPFSMASSQLLTKSQMLPDSLLNDSVPGPPDFIEDSDEDD
jgi:hypothetical protein